MERARDHHEGARCWSLRSDRANREYGRRGGVSGPRLPLPATGHSQPRPDPRRPLRREGYIARADGEVLCIVQVETKESVENLDEILAIPGVDAAYIGPADLSLSLGLPPASDHDEPAFGEAIERVLDACKRHKLAPGAHAGNVVTARKRLEQGFLMVEMCDDAGSLARSAAADLKTLRGFGRDDARISV
jgi:2-keto-3-deoxy-L-rhamnonate aldolase RhmA